MSENTLKLTISNPKPVDLEISHETVKSLAGLLKRKISGIEYVLDCQSPKNPEELKKRAKEYKAIYDLLIKTSKKDFKE